MAAKDEATTAAKTAATETKIEANVNAVAKKKYDFTKLNTLSLVSLGFSVIGGALPAVVLGHISLSQLKKHPQDGRVLAIIALVLGYLQVAGWVLGGLFMLGMAIFALTQGVPVGGLENYMHMNGWGNGFGGPGMMGWNNN